ncbi:hypothetical protein OCU04_003840 [Sclerotinia nivalis]|uniref:Heterokaryon incompatibility domain-containing protein n=1 Tax=Sclerotinia nivalis TaxID=352851 RepID=A0A9X0ATN0_9HELO|nr:hypothetical protein OCU04_003840 [Sclerotinia nivalis]
MPLVNVLARQLKEFRGTNIPSHAILSHTGSEEEVTSQNLLNAGHKHRKSYAKIEGCCREAILDCYELFWIDTCCIGKSSNTELSESLNSMCAWYNDVNVCYVYVHIADVPPDPRSI